MDGGFIGATRGGNGGGGGGAMTTTGSEGGASSNISGGIELGTARDSALIPSGTVIPPPASGSGAGAGAGAATVGSGGAGVFVILEESIDSAAAGPGRTRRTVHFDATSYARGCVAPSRSQAIVSSRSRARPCMLHVFNRPIAGGIPQSEARWDALRAQGRIDVKPIALRTRKDSPRP
jgi:hypothetical protein